MKALVFGANGQLGRALTTSAPEGWTISGRARSDVDITDDSAVEAALDAERPDIVINAAAYTAVDAAESDEEEAFRVNAEAPALIAAACAQTGARLIHVSTDYVFDGTGTTPWKPSDETDPINAYGRSKLAGEKAVLDVPGTAIVRSAWLYSAYRGNFLDTMLRLMTEREEIAVVADQTGTPTHAASLARAIWALAAAGADGIHHFTDLGETSWYGFATAIEKQAREIGLLEGCAVLPIPAAEYPTAANRPAFSVLDCSATWAITGEPRHWRDELAMALAARKATA